MTALSCRRLFRALASVAALTSACAPSDSTSPSAAPAAPSSAATASPARESVAAPRPELPKTSASAATGAASQVSATIAECQADADCVLLTEDECCVPTLCDQDRQAVTKARAEEKHLQCARKDCFVPPRKDCSIADVRVIAACRDGRCVLFEPGVGGGGRIREPRRAQ